MNGLARLALLAYPRAFRRRFGPEYLRTVADLHTHSPRRRARVALRLVREAVTVAPAMRWANLLEPTRTVLTIVAAVAVVVALLVGSEATAALAAALLVLAALSFAGRDRPIAPTDPSMTRRWYWWLAAAAGAFLVGLGVVAIDGDDQLSEAAWATWMISWAIGAVLAIVGVGLGTARLITHRH